MMIRMKLAIRKLVNQIDEGKFTGREILLTGCVLFLLGMVLGIFGSPRKRMVIASNNGNTRNSGNNNGKADKKEQEQLENEEN